MQKNWNSFNVKKGILPLGHEKDGSHTPLLKMERLDENSEENKLDSLKIKLSNPS